MFIIQTLIKNVEHGDISYNNTLKMCVLLKFCM